MRTNNKHAIKHIISVLWVSSVHDISYLFFKIKTNKAPLLTDTPWHPLPPFYGGLMMMMIPMND